MKLQNLVRVFLLEREKIVGKQVKLKKKAFMQKKNAPFGAFFIDFKFN